jgi:hypothetical protein
LRKLQIRTLQLLILTLFITVAPVSAQRPINYTISMWTFDKDRTYKADKEIKANVKNHSESAVLKIDGGFIDEDGASGDGYTDICGTRYSSTNALQWKDVRGDDDNIVEDDAQVEVIVNTTDWKNLAFRFSYRSVNTKSFDLSYHLGDGRWKILADDVVLDDDDEWDNIEVGLQDVKDLENRATITFLVHDFTRDNGRGEFQMDNIAIVGKRISTNLDCPPKLEVITPIEDIEIMLNSGDIPIFIENNGFQFQLSDDNTPFNKMSIVALSSDPNIINQLGLSVIDSDNGIFRLDIGAPYGYAGVADITLRIRDNSGNTIEQVIQYTVSDE